MDENNGKIQVAQIVGKMAGGGVESFIMNYYRNIDRNKIQFDFIIDSDSTIVPRKEIENLGGRIIEIPPYQHIFKYIKELRKIFRENKYKIVHSHMNALSIFSLFAAYLEKIPVRIVHSHSTTNKKEWKKNIIKNILKPFSKVFATSYFACSEHAGRWLFGNKTFEQGKVTIIHNAINIEKFEFNELTRQQIREELNIQDKLVIGHVGRFMKQKNHEFLIAIFAEIYKKRSDAVLLLIGEGPLEGKIKNKVEELGLKGSVYFLGVKNNVNQYMQAMDVFLFPSLYEGLGIVVIEAQSSGLTCIVSNEVPAEAKITDNVKFINLSNTKEEWASSVINSKSIRKSHIDEIRNSGYDITIESRKMLEIYVEKLREA